MGFVAISIHGSGVAAERITLDQPRTRTHALAALRSTFVLATALMEACGACANQSRRRP